MVIEYALPLVIISIAYGRMGTRLWLTRWRSYKTFCHRH
jgi:hypothetical protein